MTTQTTAFVALLTALYLCVELAFNARLLDVVGASASAAQIHSIELFGRGLSGIAVALVVLQVLLGRRARSPHGRPRTISMVFWCAVAGLLTFVSLQALVDGLVERSTPDFRRASLNLSLLQHAMVSGHALLDGLAGEGAVFSTPEGKAFVAVFPLRAMSLRGLDERMAKEKQALMERAMLDRMGGPQGVQRTLYLPALEQAKRRYQGIPLGSEVDDEVQRRHAAAWIDYSEDLGRRGWTPQTVPPRAQQPVRERVRATIPVSARWHPGDEAGFKTAVSRKLRQELMNGAGSVVVNGRTIASGLDWPRYLAHPVVQDGLRQALGLPRTVKVRDDYDPRAFRLAIVEPLVRVAAQRELERYALPVQDFAQGGRQASAGADAARATIVPPLALFLSLMGAIGHLAKLTYLLASLALCLQPRWQWAARHLWLLPVSLLAFAWVGLSAVDNAVTQSRINIYLAEQALAPHAVGGPAWFAARVGLNALHVVEVGQSRGYPVNEFIRRRLLLGFDFGYRKAPA